MNDIFPLTPFELTLIVTGLVLLGYGLIGLAQYGRK